MELLGWIMFALTFNILLVTLALTLHIAAQRDQALQERDAARLIRDLKTAGKLIFKETEE